MPARRNHLADGRNALHRRGEQFARTHIAPAAPVHDRDASYPHAVATAAQESGLMHTALPRMLGGPGLSCQDEAVLAETFGYHCTGIWGAIAIPGAALVPLLEAGWSASLRWAAAEAADGRLGAISLTEPTTPAGVEALRLTARREGDKFVLNGFTRRMSIAATASYFVVLARTSQIPGEHGASTFVVPRNTMGVVVRKALGKSGHRAYSTADVVFDDVVVDGDRLVGHEGAGLELMARALRRYRSASAAAATALAARALEIAVACAARPSSSGIPLREHRMIRERMADIAIEIEAARALATLAAVRVDSGGECEALVVKAKVFATELAVRSAATAVEISGAGLSMVGNPVGKLLRDAQVLASIEGVNPMEREVIASEVLFAPMSETVGGRATPAGEEQVRSRLARVDQAVAIMDTIPLPSIGSAECAVVPGQAPDG